MILDNLPDILNMFIRRIENFLEAFEKKFRLQKMVILKSQNRVGICSKMPIFEVKKISNALRKFSTRRMTMFNISGRLSKIISLRSKKKSESYETPIKRYQ